MWTLVERSRVAGLLVAGAVAAATLVAAPVVAAAGAAAPVVAAAGAADRAAGGSLALLTYNVAGLPAGLSSGDPAANTPRIGQLVSGYDIVNVQEDFNYHAALYANDRHPHRTATSGGAGLGDGLNTMANYPISDFERVDWSACNGTDCLTPKGFTFARVRLADGVYVDLYNVHANAGSTAVDLAARRANLAQLSGYIAVNSVGTAVIVMGDTNTRYTRAGDTIRELAAANGLTDAWVQTVRGGVPPPVGSAALVCDAAAPTDSCEVVDKILYRGSRSLRLTATRYHNEHLSFLDAGGKPLSDHFPHRVDLAWSVDPALAHSDQFGGPHGTPFTDVAGLPAAPAVRRLALRGGARLDQVSVTLTDGRTFTHGGTGGAATSLTLAPGEHLTGVRLAAGQRNGRTRIFFAEFTTDRGTVVAAGTPTANAVTYRAPAGWQIVGFHGRAGAEVDKLGVIVAPR